MELCSVCVVIPFFNNSAEAMRAVRSVLNQTLPPRKVLLIDDASQESELDLLKAELTKVSSDVDVQLMSQDSNRGPGAARDMGWDNAEEDYIAFLDSDDEWHAQKLEIQFSYMLENPEINISATAYEVGLSSKDKRFSGFEVQSIGRRRLLFGNPYATSTVMVKRSLASRFGQQRYSEDYLLWMNIILGEKKNGMMLEVPLSFYHKETYGASGLSAKMWRMERGELRNFFALRRSHLITWPECLGAVTLSLAKYIKREVMVRLR